jgi:hypothetical protein
MWLERGTIGHRWRQKYPLWIKSGVQLPPVSEHAAALALDRCVPQSD